MSSFFWVAIMKIEERILFSIFHDIDEFYSCFHLREDTRNTIYTDKMEFHVVATKLYHQGWKLEEISRIVDISTEVLEEKMLEQRKR